VRLNVKYFSKQRPGDHPAYCTFEKCTLPILEIGHWKAKLFYSVILIQVRVLYMQGNKVKLSTASLSQQLAEGEKLMPVYQEAFQKYHPAVLRQLTYLLGNRFEAEDITQETFIKLYNSPPKECKNIGGWLSKVATNLAYNYMRSEKSRKRREEKVIVDLEALSTPEDISIKNEELALVNKALEALDERGRICLIMKHSGFKYEDIASATGMKKTSVGTIIARSQARFKNIYLQLKGSDS